MELPEKIITGEVGHTHNIALRAAWAVNKLIDYLAEAAGPPLSDGPIEVSGSTARTCCEDWNLGVNQINGAFQMSTVHHGQEYLGKPFNYCPWCGEQRTRY